MTRIAQRWLLRKLSAMAGLTVALLTPIHLEAQYDYDPREMALLPPYCKYTQIYFENVPGGRDESKIMEWYGKMGGVGGRSGPFHHMHHYCRALQHINYGNLFTKSRAQRIERLVWAVGEFDYVLRNTTPAFALWPEILTKKGESLIALGNAPLAVRELERAIQLKPDYWPPYAALSDYFKGAGNPRKAREVLEQGLAASPDATALKRRLAELEGIKNPSKAPPDLAKKPAVEAVK